MFLTLALVHALATTPMGTAGCVGSRARLGALEMRKTFRN